MVISPGSRPVMNARSDGIGTAGGVETGENARVKPPLKLFRKVEEKTCVSCNATTWPARAADLREIRVCSRVDLVSIGDQVVDRERIFTGRVVVKPGQAKIL